MCLAIPGMLVEVYEEEGLRMGRVDYSGTSNTACLEFVEQAEVGDYVLVHAGFALNVLDEEEARKTLDTWEELVQAAAAEGTDVFGLPLQPSVVETAGTERKTGAEPTTSTASREEGP